MGYRIGSFNVHNMGQYAKDIKIKKIASIIKTYNFDIVALQEVFCSKLGVITQQNNGYPITPLLYELGKDSYGGNWQAYFAAPPQARDAKEGYVFLWNSRVRLPSTKISDGTSRIFYPKIFNQYKLDKSNKQMNLVRNPLYARFIPVAQPFMEFRIINTHIRFSGSPEVDVDNTDYVGLGDIAMRRNEFDVLSKTIYPKISSTLYSNQDEGKLGSFYTILIGDCNLNLRRNWTKSPYFLSEIFEIEDRNMKSMKMHIYQESLSTIKRITPENQQDFENEEKFSNNFDHVVLDDNRFVSGCNFKIKALPVVRSKFADYRMNISDHIPISMEFENK